MASRPHVAVWGKTGSGKSTVLLGLILQFFGMGADVRFIDGKSEFSSFGKFYGKQKIGSNVAGVVGILERVKAEVEHRQQFIAELNSQDGKMGRTAADLNYRPLVLLVDEIGAILATMAPKSQKEMIESLVAIIMKGRSVGVHVVLATQDPSTDTLPSKIRSQFSTRILLGSANQETQRMAFGEVATTGQVEKFRGFYTCDGLTVQPMRFYVCDLHTYGLNDLTAFEQSYKLGSAVHYSTTAFSDLDSVLANVGGQGRKWYRSKISHDFVRIRTTLAPTRPNKLGNALQINIWRGRHSGEEEVLTSLFQK